MRITNRHGHNEVSIARQPWCKQNHEMNGEKDGKTMHKWKVSKRFVIALVYVGESILTCGLTVITQEFGALMHLQLCWHSAALVHTHAHTATVALKCPKNSCVILWTPCCTWCSVFYYLTTCAPNVIGSDSNQPIMGSGDWKEIMHAMP